MRKIFNKWFDKKDTINNKRFKKSITINQIKNEITIEGDIDNKQWSIKSLILVDRIIGHEVVVENLKYDHQFLYVIKLTDLAKENINTGTIYDLYVNISKNTEETTNGQVEHENGNISRLRLGRFNETKLNIDAPAVIDDVYYQLYTTVKGNISISVNKEVDANYRLKLHKMSVNNQKVLIRGTLFTDHIKPDKFSLMALGRVTSKKYISPVDSYFIEDLSSKKYGLNYYEVIIDTTFNAIFEQGEIQEDIYDLFILLNVDNQVEPVKIRIGSSKFRNKKFSFNNYLEKEKHVFSITPYLTVKKFNLSLQVDKFEKDTYKYLKKMMRWGWVSRLLNFHQEIWIVGERPYKAQDTGYHFFKYMRENYPDKEVYYVIEKDSPEYKNVVGLGNTLIYKSKEHVKMTFLAKWLIGSHHLDYIYPSRTADFKRKIKGKKAFLQHGVLGTKNTVHFYGKSSPSFETDLFIVSSKYEKQIVVKDFGYLESEVAVTGLSRFDSLFDGGVNKRRQLLIIPTWREWLVSTEQFLESEYLERYQSLINNEKLHQLSKDYNFEIIFCLHPNMQVYTQYFKNDNIKVISQGEVDVQILMKESAMMITDYSSVAFDFSFLNRPVIYYQFDRKRFIGRRGSHLNLDEELPGDIVWEESELLLSIEQILMDNFEMKVENKEKSNKFIKYKDRRSSERIYQAIINYRRPKVTTWNWRNSQLVKKAFRRFRKSKIYFPIMKSLYRVARVCIPVDNKLIVFESGIGKQYSDSPRYIYEEILKRKLPYKKVWIYKGTQHFRDANTKVVTRLSPLYYYYLARAGYWVNNQNFPTYIKKPKNTIYIQTWHGTPLKKMLFDIEQIQGRSSSYRERVYNATKTWDYLISPSKYATDCFKSAFKYEGEILEIGYPRNDIFYKSNVQINIERLKQRLFIPKDKKVILYAPTFRDNQVSQNGKFLFDINMNLEKMKQSLGEDYIILLRMHVIVSNKIKVPLDLRDFVYNVSNYSDIQELYLITDILITDYSSVMFDFANTKKPMIFYTYDLDLYRDQTRGFYMDFEQEAPGPLVFNTEEIISNIKNIEVIEEDFREKYSYFLEKYCNLEDDKASKRIVDKFFNK